MIIANFLNQPPIFFCEFLTKFSKNWKILKTMAIFLYNMAVSSEENLGISLYTNVNVI